jgi:hypothetical protein
LYTEKQRLLNLPFPLTVAATLSYVATAGAKLPSNSKACHNDVVNDHDVVSDNDQDHNNDITTRKQRDALFHRLQQIWMDRQQDYFNQLLLRRRLPKNRCQERYYAWSPTLVLSVDVLPVVAIFQSHLQQRCCEMMQQAKVAQQELLQMEVTTTTAATTKPHKGLSKMCKNRTCREQSLLKSSESQRHDLDVSDSNSDDDEKIHVETDETNIVDNATANSINVQCDRGINLPNGNNSDYELSFLQSSMTINNDWKQVHIRRKVPVDVPPNDDIDIDTTIVEPIAQLTALQKLPSHHYDTAKNSSTSASSADTNHFVSSIQRNDTLCDRSTKISICAVSTDGETNESSAMPIVHSDSRNHDVLDTEVDDIEYDQQSEVPILLETIKDLKQQLQVMNKQRIEDQHLTQKALQLERDVAYEHIQALQLRLYIAETRLQTYEEALQSHVEMVQRNVATPITSIQNDLGQSLNIRDTITTTETEAIIIGSPLYARRTGTSTAAH